jgi:hypothetical protein
MLAGTSQSIRAAAADAAARPWLPRGLAVAGAADAAAEALGFF